jgi:hypothetical protein
LDLEAPIFFGKQLLPGLLIVRIWDYRIHGTDGHALRGLIESHTLYASLVIDDVDARAFADRLLETIINAGGAGDAIIRDLQRHNISSPSLDYSRE